MGRWKTLERICRSGIVAILRGLEPGTVLPAARALAEGGIEVLEITVDSPAALDRLGRLREELGGELLLGAGTVLDAETARAALLAGAEFIVTPTLDARVIETANRYGSAVLPGAMTPTEILQAFSAGATAVKVFPASVLGAGYLRQVRGPLGHVPLIPTGGIDANNLHEYFAAGAVAVGVGGSLIDRRALAAGHFHVLTQRARQLVEAAAQARSR